jgi:hypothetical protein
MGWNREELKRGAFVLVGLLVVAIIWIGVYSKEKECAAKGGERLRPLWGTFACYDKASLREMK